MIRFLRTLAGLSRRVAHSNVNPETAAGSARSSEPSPELISLWAAHRQIYAEYDMAKSMLLASITESRTVDAAQWFGRCLALALAMNEIESRFPQLKRREFQVSDLFQRSQP